MVSHRLFSISPVLGGKNSKEIAGARWPSGAGDVNSDIGTTTLRFKPAGNDSSGCRAPKIGQTRSLQQPIACGKLPNFCETYENICSISRLVGKDTDRA